MNRGVSTGNPIIIAAFHSSLGRQLLIVICVLAAVALAWLAVRVAQVARARAADPMALTDPGTDGAEPVARLVLRIAFGVIWTLDGLLQLQSAMPAGLPSGVLSPAADGSPSWVHRIVGVGVTIWSNHPVTAAASAVWIQLGVGIALLVAPRGRWSRGAGLVSAGWGTVVWVFGEAFGGIFGSGGSFLFGLPGAAVFYVVAGVLIALPERTWRSATIGRYLLRGFGVFVIAMGVLQALPGRGAWSGQATPRATPGLLTAMVQQMAQTPQPSTLAAWLRDFAGFDAAHGFAVNLVVVVALLVIGVSLAVATPRVALVGVVVGLVFCLATWVLVQDLGFLGGLGTDPNSMVPFCAVMVAGYLALVRPRRTPEPVAASAGPTTSLVARLESLSPRYLARVGASLVALSVVAVGAAPMALASANPNADSILTEAVNGTPNLLDYPAAPFSLIDQHGHRVSLSSLRGSTVVLTFLDPVCSSDCPLIAQELHAADVALGSEAAGVQFVAIVANPVFDSIAVTQAFDREEDLAAVANWHYLSGPVGLLQHVWDDYGIVVDLEPAGAMVDHSELVYIVDRTGHVRVVLDADPGDSTALHSSFSTLLEAEIRKVAAP